MSMRISGYFLLGLVMAAVPCATWGALQHRYEFSETGGTVVADTVGTSHGTLVNTTGASTLGGGVLTLGNDGSQTSNSGTGDYVDLPNGIIKTLGSRATYETWIDWTGGANWQRIFDFGTSDGGEDVSSGGGTAHAIVATPNNGTGVATQYRVPGTARIITGTGGLPTGTQKHLAVVWDETDTSAELYVDGRLIGRDNATHLQMINIIDNNNWLGRSQYNDTLFNGAYKEFRLYNHPLSAEEIMESYLAGPDQVGTVDLGAPISMSIVGDTEVIPGLTIELVVLANYATESGIEIRSDDQLIWSVDDESVATISQDGVVTGVAEGSVFVTAEYRGLMESEFINVLSTPLPPAELRHQYSFNEPASGGIVTNGFEPDRAGFADATVWRGEYPGDGTLSMVATHSAYVDLQNGIISELTNATFETWVTPMDAAGNWRRFFDFGSSSSNELDHTLPIPAPYNGTDYLYLSARIGGANRMRYQVNPPGGGEGDGVRIETPAYTAGTEMHLVVTYNYEGRLATVYQDGQVVGSAPLVTSLSAIPDVNNWLGRSQYSGDAFFNGTLNEFRIYEGVLTPLQVVINKQQGPDQPAVDPGDLVSVSLSAATNVLFLEALDLPTEATADYQNVTGLVINTLSETIFESSDTNVIQVSDVGVLSSIGAGSATITVRYSGQEDSMFFEARPIDRPIGLLHRYSFSEGVGSTQVMDSVGGADGTVEGLGATYGGGALTLPGGAPVDNAAYINLPNGLVSGLPGASTFEIWFTWQEAANWSRIFDFGTSEGGEDISGTGLAYLILTPQAGDNGSLVGVRYTTTGYGNEAPVLNGAAALPNGTAAHVVLVYSSDEGFTALYVDGMRVDQQLVLPSQALNRLTDVNNWLGRSQWGGNQRIKGIYDEFRIYSGIMTDTEVAESFARGPDALPPSNEFRFDAELQLTGDGHLVLSWPVESGTSVAEKSAMLAPAPSWSSTGLVPVETNGQYRLMLTVTELEEYFRIVE